MPSSQPPLYILAIDSPGVWALSSLLILKKIMGELQKSVGSELVIYPWQMFDFISGTSTGGLFAIMLGRLRMSVDEAIGHYSDLSEALFSSPRCFGGIRFMAFGTPVYDGSPLETWFKKIAAQSDATKHDEDALMHEPFLKDSDGEYCHTFVLGLRKGMAAAQPELFQTYEPGATYKIWECARATAATGGFFDAVDIQAGTPTPPTHSDGAFTADNPSDMAHHQAHTLFRDQIIGCSLSLGPGLRDVVKLKGNLFYTPNTSKHRGSEVFEQTLTVTEEMSRLPKSPYFRFSMKKGTGTIYFDNRGEEANVRDATHKYMDYSNQTKALKDCVEALKPKAKHIMTRRQLV